MGGGICMADPTFKSSLSIEEIEDNFKDVNLFEEIKAGLEEALEYEKNLKNKNCRENAD
jgi:hypothetical protein